MSRDESIKQQKINQARKNIEQVKFDTSGIKKSLERLSDVNIIALNKEEKEIETLLKLALIKANTYNNNLENIMLGIE